MKNKKLEKRDTAPPSDVSMEIQTWSIGKLVQYCPANAQGAGGKYLHGGRLGWFLSCRDLKTQNANNGAATMRDEPWPHRILTVDRFPSGS
jgi:hypothetical protein